MNATVHAFPAFGSLDSPRAWIMAAIVLLHWGLFWALTSGLARHVIPFIPADITARLIPADAEPLPPPPRLPEYRPQTSQPVVPEFVPNFGLFSENAISLPEAEPGPVPVPVPEARPTPVVVPPKIDPRRNLSEPTYPPQDVRLGNTGTVLLSVLVLPDGRVGEVRLERTSGHARLDASALDEARRWRFLPGTEDGTPKAMWKQLPITFRLQN